MSERRSTGEGTIMRLPDGTWWGQTSLGYSVVYDDRGRPLQRRRIRRSVRGRTRAEATPGTREAKPQAKPAVRPGTAGHRLWCESCTPWWPRVIPLGAAGGGPEVGLTWVLCGPLDAPSDRTTSRCRPSRVV